MLTNKNVIFCVWAAHLDLAIITPTWLLNIRVKWNVKRNWLSQLRLCLSPIFNLYNVLYVNTLTWCTCHSWYFINTTCNKDIIMLSNYDGFIRLLIKMPLLKTYITYYVEFSYILKTTLQNLKLLKVIDCELQIHLFT